MPEGDTIHNAARRVGAALVGKPIESIETPQLRHARDRWPERLEGRARPLRGRPRQASVPALRGRPHPPLAPAHGRRLERLPARPALAPEPAPGLARDPDARARGGPVRRPRARADDRLAHALRPAAREPRPGRAGGGVRRGEVPAPPPRGRPDAAASPTPFSTSATWPASGTSGRPRPASWRASSPWRPIGATSPTRRALEIVDGIRPLMHASAEGGFQQRDPWVFERHGRPCRRCSTLIKARGQGDDNRTTYWCPACQP